MLTYTELERDLARHRALAIIRAHDVASGRNLALEVIDAGWGVLEVSLTTPSALDLIGELGSRTEVVVGAGTVRNSEDARRSSEAGARFLVSPGLPDDLADILALGLPVLPGVFTPSDIMRAAEAGISCLMLFPANLIGAAAIAAYREPFPGSRFVAVGGVNRQNASDWLAAGALAVGVSSGLRPKHSDNPGELKRHLIDFKESIRA